MSELSKLLNENVKKFEKIKFEKAYKVKAKADKSIYFWYVKRYLLAQSKIGNNSASIVKPFWVSTELFSAVCELLSSFYNLRIIFLFKHRFIVEWFDGTDLKEEVE